jgi:hypothetical protein
VNSTQNPFGSLRFLLRSSVWTGALISGCLALGASTAAAAQAGGGGGKPGSGGRVTTQPKGGGKEGTHRPLGGGAQPTANEADTATAIRGLPPSSNGADAWWSAHGGVIHVGDPDRPAVLLVHGLHQTAEDFVHPSIVGFNYDVGHTPPDRDLGTSDTAGVGVESLGVSGLLDVDGSGWFDFLVSKGCTVATWTLPSYDVSQAMASALEAVTHLQFATHTLNPSSPPSIALVGHSLGGLVVRALLKERGNFGGQIRWVITLGSPHQGSELAVAPAKLEADAASWVGHLPLPDPLKAPVADVARQTCSSLIEMFAPPLDPQSVQLAPGSPMLTALAAGETALPGVRYDTFGGTDPNYLRVYAWVFDAESAVPQVSGLSIYFKWTVHANEIGPVSPLLAKLPDLFPEITPGKGDGLVASARAHLPWSTRHTVSLNHAQMLWDRGLQNEVAAILLGSQTPGFGKGKGISLASLQQGLEEARDAVHVAVEAALAELFAVIPNTGLKGRLGRIVCEFPKDAKDVQAHIEVFSTTSDGKQGDQAASGYGNQTMELLPGTYVVVVGGVSVPSVRVQSKSDTRMKVGALHVIAASGTHVEVLDAAGAKELTNFYGEKTVGLPAGSYRLRIAGQLEPVRVDADAITEF